MNDWAKKKKKKERTGKIKRERERKKSCMNDLNHSDKINGMNSCCASREIIHLVVNIMLLTL